MTHRYTIDGETCEPCCCKCDATDAARYLDIGIDTYCGSCGDEIIAENEADAAVDASDLTARHLVPAPCSLAGMDNAADSIPDASPLDRCESVIVMCDRAPSLSKALI